MQISILLLFALSVISPFHTAAASQDSPAAEYTRHFHALTELSIAVAEAMPREQYGFRPHPDSMDFGQLIGHVATTNYQFCAGLKDAQTPALPSPADKDGIVKFVKDSFEYCSSTIANLSEDQLTRTHKSPDGVLPGRDILLAMYIHVAHHRGQAEIYLRDKGIKPPNYRV